MCGITAYLGHRDALQVILSGLKRLEYRGYDSAGVGLVVSNPENGSSLRVIKKKGKVANLESATKDLPFSSQLGIGHTRWATHGPPADHNSHPHTDELGTVAVVHNGIIENYSSLKQALIEKGYKFSSETDTELLAHLFYDIRKHNPKLSLPSVVREGLQAVEGAYGICVLFSDQPDLLIGARLGSPLLLGVGEGEYFLASDASAVIEYTKTVEYLKEREMVTITREGYEITSLDVCVGNPNIRSPDLQTLDITLEAIEKGGHKHFMIKEIMEQPKAISDAMRGRVNTETGEISLGSLTGVTLERFARARRIIIAACGTSFHSGQVGEYLLESLARIPVEVEYASEFRYRNPILYEDDILIVMSQSGETADTLAAVREAKEKNIMTYGIVNVVGSSIARETDAGCYLHVGPEIGVASTKAFTGQVVVLTMLAIQLAKIRGVADDVQVKSWSKALQQIPDQMRALLSQNEKILDLARSYRFAQSFLYLGRGYNFPVALEGALKLKEISYIHAEGYAAAEMKHGPIALVDRFMPVVMIAPSSDRVYDKIKSNIEEVMARGGNVIAITDEGNNELEGKCEAVIYVPKTEEWLSPLLNVVPLQLLSYHIADLRKCNVDQPRNLAKSVTVE